MSESLSATGTVVHVAETMQISATFKKRDIVIEIVEDNPQYSQLISFQFVQDKTDILDSFAIGKQVEIGFNLRGRKWDGPKGTQYFNTLQGWKINEVGASNQYGAPPAPYQQAPATAPAPTPSQLPDNGLDEDVPF